MIVKSFEGINMKDALQAVKKEFGSDAVILSTNEKLLENSNIKIVEIRAAAPENQRMIGAASAKTSNIPSFNSSQLESRIQGLESKIKALSDNMITKIQFQNIEGGLQEIKLFTLEALRNKEGSMIEGLPNNLITMESSLRHTGIADIHITKLMQYLISLPEPSNLELTKYETEEEYYKAHAIKWMFKKIKIAEPWDIVSGSTSIHTLIGPTGSGKTMTIAKVANYFAKKEHSKVLIICYDNQRIAASEQLRIYSKVLNVDFEVISHANELSDKVLKHRNADLILIDTAGRCPKLDSEIEDLKNLNEYSMPIEYHLVLPVTEKEQQLDKAVRGFSELGIDSFIFTKLDEAWTYGELYNLNQKWNIPISFFSTGQDFPNDFERATRERVVERIFGI